MHELLEVPPPSAMLRSGTWCRYRMVTSTSSIPIALWNPERDTMFIQLRHPMLQFAWLIDYSSLMGCQCEPYNLHSRTPMGIASSTDALTKCARRFVSAGDVLELTLNKISIKRTPASQTLLNCQVQIQPVQYLQSSFHSPMNDSHRHYHWFQTVLNPA